MGEEKEKSLKITLFELFFSIALHSNVGHRFFLSFYFINFQQFISSAFRKIFPELPVSS
jgi:hypothetical protein